MPCCARAASRSFRRSPDLHFRTMETPTMTPDAFETSLRDPSPPPALGPALLALWHQGRGEWHAAHGAAQRSEEHTSELQSLMRISYAVFCLKKKKQKQTKDKK